MKSGIELITEERQRQIDVEGWTPEHDAEHSNNELSKAAIVYASDSQARENSNIIDWLWPWERAWWKPTPDNRVKELVKAGALIAAEIDRLQAGGKK